jgi:hypothetical protein
MARRASMVRGDREREGGGVRAMPGLVRTTLIPRAGGGGHLGEPPRGPGRWTRRGRDERLSRSQGKDRKKGLPSRAMPPRALLFTTRPRPRSGVRVPANRRMAMKFAGFIHGKWCHVVDPSLLSSELHVLGPDH